MGELLPEREEPRNRKMSDTLGIKNQGDRNVWDEPDPRVKWALDILDDQGFETIPYSKRFSFPAMFGAIGVGLGAALNLAANKPLRASMPRTIFFAGAFTGIGWAWMVYRARRQANNEAVARHYIMLHPDRFPEPEMLKLETKEFFCRGKCARTMKN